MWRALNSGDTESAKETLQGLGKWMASVNQRAGDVKNEPVNAESKKLADERAAWESEKRTAHTNETGKAASSETAKLLGKSLAPFLKENAFIKGLSPTAKELLGKQILARVYAEMKGDSLYQKQVKAYWGQKVPDRAKIVDLTKTVVERLANRGIVREVISDLFPQALTSLHRSKTASAAAAKKAAGDTAEKKAAATGSAVYVATKPEWKSILWDRDPQQLLYITGKAWITGKTGPKLVTWRKP
jgi:hypothetical protein